MLKTFSVDLDLFVCGLHKTMLLIDSALDVTNNI